eukprot:TRINITY_DN1964_c0_g1_i1.p1 TRINITY_DN1964_c0_g1~~TRINITY_DN1964_c0_g1_i1.p1  ORF type:complete len:164 (-),score=64.36 TRINITY_DN1964_c0_g1_i1:97-588(-)
MEETKGILKHNASAESANKKRTRLVWDEDNLTTNENEVSFTMKIDEPPTPYHYYEDEEEDIDGQNPSDGKDLSPSEPTEVEESDNATGNTGANSSSLKWSELEDKLHKAKEEEDSAMDSDGPVLLSKEDKFEKQRKQHYNEFQMVKKMKDEVAEKKSAKMEES